MQHIPVGDVLMRARGLEPEPLESKTRPQEPILVREDMILVDGLRRLNWYIEHEIEEIPAVVTSDWPTLVAELARQHEGRTVTPRRTYEINRDVMAEFGVPWAKALTNFGWKRTANGTWARGDSGRSHKRYDPQFSARGQLIAALNSSKHVHQDSILMYARAEEGNELAIELCELIDKGVISPNMAYDRFRHPNNLVGNVVALGEQRRILERGVAGIEAQVTALRKLGHPLKVSVEEVSTARKQLEVVSRELTTMINGLRKWEKENG